MATAALDLSSTQQTLQFLSSVLSQRGPTALPYTEDTKWLIRQHLLSLTETHPSLIPQTATFTHNDGRSVNLLQADGTVPMTYQGITYNIPVIIWLMESYPRQPPEVYVNPTRDMVIKRPHEYVDPSGVVRIPYLQDWIYPSSNLVGMVKNLSDCFGKDPPLYSQRRNSNPNPNPNFEAASRTSSSGSLIGQPRREDYPSPPSSYGRTLPASQQTQAKEDPDEVFRRHAIAKIVEMANKDLTSLRNTRETEMDELGNIQQELRRRGWEMDRGLNEMRRELAALEEQLQTVLMNTDVLEGWLRKNEAKMLMPGDGDESVDEMFEVCDMLSKQMLECAGSDLAIEDVVYCLDTAVQNGLIPFEVYLRNVRLLAREQFLSRALGEKVKAEQMQSQVANMAARIQQFVRSG